MKYESYLEMPREPKSKDKKIWQDYFKKFQQRFIHNERVFMLYRTTSFEQKSIKKVNNEYKYLLENELIILSNLVFELNLDEPFVFISYLQPTH